MAVSPQRTYFAGQLAGERPLTQRTATRLCRLAAQIGVLQPWHALVEEQLIAVVRKRGCEPDFVSVLGSLGEHRAIHVYPGFRGYSWYREVLQAEDATRLLATECEALQLSYPDPDEITDLDVELIRGCRFEPRQPAFQFRSARPGYLPWYPNNEECRRLADCLEGAMALLLTDLVVNHQDDLWPDDGQTLPLLAKTSGSWRISLVKFDLSHVSPPRLWVSEERLAGLPSRKAGVLCLGDYVMPGCAGGEDDRPVALHLIAVVENRSGFAFPPRLREPGEVLAAAASDVLLDAIACHGAVPKTVLVANPYYVDSLAELARVAGFEIKLRRRLPMLDELFIALARVADGDIPDSPHPVQ